MLQPIDFFNMKLYLALMLSLPHIDPNICIIMNHDAWLNSYHLYTEEF